MLTITRCFSTLIASGNGKRCKELSSILSNTLLSKDEDGVLKSLIFKSDHDKYKQKNSQISSEIALKINHLYDDIDDFYFVNDLRENG